ncbi:hypothetical protein GOV14_04700 [Candidatus Pacearchaeota archaeon]|nr:hypothetical protein [Candidatus Pacearchaeota archaeon]
MNKKAQGISINVIIIAAIALIVLVVLIAVFTGRFGLFSEGVEAAAACEQACKAIGLDEAFAGYSDSECGEKTRKRIPGVFYDKEKTKACCCLAN